MDQKLCEAKDRLEAARTNLIETAYCFTNAEGNFDRTIMSLREIIGDLSISIYQLEQQEK